MVSSKSLSLILKSHDTQKTVFDPPSSEPCKIPDPQGSSSNDVNNFSSSSSLILKLGTLRGIWNSRRLVINQSYGSNKLLGFFISHGISCYWKHGNKANSNRYQSSFVKDTRSHLLVEKAKKPQNIVDMVLFRHAHSTDVRRRSLLLMKLLHGTFF